MLVSFNPKGHTQVFRGKATMNWKDRDGKIHVNDVKYAKWAFDGHRIKELQHEALIYEEMRSKGEILGKIAPEFYGYYEAFDKKTGKLVFVVSVFDFHQSSSEKQDLLLARAPTTKPIE